MKAQNQLRGEYNEQFDVDRRSEESDWTLNAIVGAIVTNRLPPDDAFAWARIAAHEAASDAASDKA